MFGRTFGESWKIVTIAFSLWVSEFIITAGLFRGLEVSLSSVEFLRGAAGSSRRSLDVLLLPGLTGSKFMERVSDSPLWSIRATVRPGTGGLACPAKRSSGLSAKMRFRRKNPFQATLRTRLAGENKRVRLETWAYKPRLLQLYWSGLWVCVCGGGQCGCGLTEALLLPI
jgi:hypothetical protein